MDCNSLITRNMCSVPIVKNAVRLEKGVIVIFISNNYFNNYTLNQIIGCINYAHNKYSLLKMPIKFVFSNMVLIDKLTYTIFECICKSLIENYGHKVSISFDFNHNITTQGIKSSPLMLLSADSKKIAQNNIKFLEKFNSEVYHLHYRKVLKYEEYSGEKLSQIYDEVFYFQKSFNTNYNCIDKISEVVVELIGNAFEHTKSDCLVDIDIAPNYLRKGNDLEGKFCGINISVINFSDLLLGDGIKDKMEDYALTDDNDTRYSRVLEAFEYHQKHFSATYDETDFYNVSAFQHMISGRKKNYTTGGTGLTLLIKSIEERADAHSCYVLTGSRMVALLPEYLEYDDNYWLGFNEFNDYFTHIPNRAIIGRSVFFFPGTAYNLNFVMKVDDSDDERKVY